MLSGLLSAHYITIFLDISSRRDSVYFIKVVDLADRLLGAYNSPSGIPCASMYLASRTRLVSHAEGGASSTAEAMTLPLKTRYLSKIIGNKIYWRKAEKVVEVVDSVDVHDDLVPILISPRSGSFTITEIRLRSRGDSYYGKLLKARDS
jgi:mannosyl-oligosaccharide alpha-1,2-mannosidase